MSEDLLAGRYRILSPLGAVKLLPDSIEADTVARERLRREALAAAARDHPF